MYNNIKKRAFQLIILFGIISLLGDIIYEGGRSAHGQYLKLLGVQAVTVGFIVGFGEFLGYFFRLISGFFADKTKSYWFLTIFGYFLLASIPLISTTGSWRIIAFLIVLERIGKGIRTPARDTLTSFVAEKVGTGFGFGITEFLDQIGAILGPLIFAFVFSTSISNQNAIGLYQRGYGIFWGPFILLALILFYTYFSFKRFEKLEKKSEKVIDRGPLPINFWFYILFTFITTLGFLNFPLIGFHLKKLNLFSDQKIFIFYTLAMAIDGIIALIVGKIYDRLKTKFENFYFLLLIPLFSAFLPYLVFSKTLFLFSLGIVLFGFIIGLQETILKAVIADITPIERRSRAYGIFNFSLGIAFFVGSTIAGKLYDFSLPVLIVTLAIIELSSLPFFWLMKKKTK